jgi:pyruvate formate lyase activating enzyme
MTAWREQHVPASFGEPLGDGSVRCHLSPRNCVIGDGKLGFCKVRGNVDGRMVSYNYGKSVHLTEETIETEAVFHYAPGMRTLSLGNIGCMLNCSYCQNWKTSQARYISDSDVHHYTPEQLVETALAHGIEMFSWTYNDPVVWHEFVRDTSRLGQQAGIRSLYKSAFYIEPEAIDELIPSIDIFSVSLKAMSEDYYRRYTTGRLQPVLDAIRHVRKSGKHLELSNLMITDISDTAEDAQVLAEWVADNVGTTTPLHFVRFHPDYKLRNTRRTPVDRLIRAGQIARAVGMEHIYIGNVFDQSLSATRCLDCDQLLVERFGLNAVASGLDAAGCCTACGRDHHFTAPLLARRAPTVPAIPDAGFGLRDFDWHGAIGSIHVQVANRTDQASTVYHRRRNADASTTDWTVVPLPAGESYRFIISRGSDGEVGAEVALPPGCENNLHEVFDRAHFPTVSVDDAAANDDISPLPFYPGNQLKTKPAPQVLFDI